MWESDKINAIWFKYNNYVRQFTFSCSFSEENHTNGIIKMITTTTDFKVNLKSQ